MWSELRRLAGRLQLSAAGLDIDYSELRDFIGNAEIAMVAYSTGGQLVFKANEAFARLIGHQREEIIGRSVADVLQGWQDAQSIKTVAWTVVAEGRCLEMQVRRGQPSDGEGCYHAYGWPMRNSAGHLVGGILAIVDVTDQKRSQDLEVCKRTCLDAVVDEIPEMALLVDLRSGLARINRAGCRRLRYGETLATWSRLSNLPWRIRLESEREAGWHDISWLGDALTARSSYPVEMTLQVMSNAELTFSARGRPLLDERGEIVGAILVGQDTGGDAAEEQSEEQSFSVIAHELRNALTPVKGYGQIAARVQDDRREAALAGLNRSIAAFTTIVDQMLDASRLGLGSYKPTRRVINLVSLVAEVVEQQRLLNEQHNLALQAAEPEVLVDCDPTCIARVLANLLDNAVKYSPAGSKVVVSVSRQRGEALVSVCDQGIGMSKEDAARIFDRFYRASAAHRLRPEGLGLGLYIVRQLVALHEGRLWAESVEGDGSTFYVALPTEMGQ